MKLGVTIENVATDTPELLALVCDIQSKFAFANMDMPTGIQVSEQAFREFTSRSLNLTFVDTELLAYFEAGVFEFELMGVCITFDRSLKQGEFRLEFKSKE